MLYNLLEWLHAPSGGFHWTFGVITNGQLVLGIAFWIPVFVLVAVHLISDYKRESIEKAKSKGHKHRKCRNSN